MRLIILKDPSTVAHWVATYVKKRILAFAPTPDRKFVLGLPTGSSPLPGYQKQVAFHQAGEVSFANVVTFNMDEYCGLPVTHKQSYHSYMYECVRLALDRCGVFLFLPPCLVTRTHPPPPAQELFQVH